MKDRDLIIQSERILTNGGGSGSGGGGVEEAYALTFS